MQHMHTVNNYPLNKNVFSWFQNISDDMPGTCCLDDGYRNEDHQVHTAQQDLAYFGLHKLTHQRSFSNNLPGL